VGKRERVGKREEFDGNLLFSHSVDPAFEAYPSTGRGTRKRRLFNLLSLPKNSSNKSFVVPPSRRRSF